MTSRVPPGPFQEGQDYRLRLWDRGHPVLVLALHGGQIEPGTSPLAARLAGADWSLYDFQGIRPHGNGQLHRPSVELVDPRLVELAGRAWIALSLHGATGVAPLVGIGGRNRRLARRVQRQLAALGVVCVDLGAGLQGRARRNPVNWPLRRGVQLELSAGLRRQLARPAAAVAFCVALRQGVAAYLVQPLTNRDPSVSTGSPMGSPVNE